MNINIKKITSILALFTVSLSISQADQGGNDPIGGIDIIIKEDPASRPVNNPDKNPLIDQINKLEFEYLNLCASQIQKNFAVSKEAKAAKTKEAVFKAYIQHLQKEVKKLKIVNVERGKIINKKILKKLCQ